MLEPGSLWPSVRFHCSHWFAPSVSTCGDSWWLVLPGPSPGRGPPPPQPQLEAQQPLALFPEQRAAPGLPPPRAQSALRPVWGGVWGPPFLSPAPVHRGPVCSVEMGTRTWDSQVISFFFFL